jgi:hypothetical protein
LALLRGICYLLPTEEVMPANSPASGTAGANRRIEAAASLLRVVNPRLERIVRGGIAASEPRPPVSMGLAKK